MGTRELSVSESYVQNFKSSGYFALGTTAGGAERGLEISQSLLSKDNPVSIFPEVVLGLGGGVVGLVAGVLGDVGALTVAPLFKETLSAPGEDYQTRAFENGWNIFSNAPWRGTFIKTPSS